MATESRLPRTRSAALMAAAQAAQSVHAHPRSGPTPTVLGAAADRTAPGPEPSSSSTAATAPGASGDSSRSALLGHARRASGIQPPRLSVRRSTSKGSLAQTFQAAATTDKDTAVDATHEETGAGAAAPSVAGASRPLGPGSQIPRSSIPRPVSIASIAAVLPMGRGGDKEKDRTKDKDNGGSNGRAAAPPDAPKAGGNPSRTLRNTRSVTSLRSTKAAADSGLPKPSSKTTDKDAAPGNKRDQRVDTGRPPAGKENITTQTHEHDDTKEHVAKEKNGGGAKRALKRLSKDVAVPSPRPISPPKVAALRVNKRRPKSLSDGQGLFSSGAKLASNMHGPPRMSLVQEADVSFGLDSPSPLPGSLAASRNGKTASSTAAPSLAGTPTSSLSAAVGAAVAAAVSANAQGGADSPLSTGSRGPFSRGHSRAASVSSLLDRVTSHSPSRNGGGGGGGGDGSDTSPAPEASLPSPMVITADKAPAPPTTGGKKKAPRLSVPDTPAIRQLLARERELSRLGDRSGIFEADLSLASSASFGQLTPPVSRLAQSTTAASITTNTNSPVSGRFGFLDRRTLSRGAAKGAAKDSSGAKAHAPDAELQAVVAQLQGDNAVLAERLAALSAEETRLKTLAERALRDRSDALAAQEEAEARRDAAVWDSVLQHLDEAMEEETAFRATLASLRAVVEAM